ncbi:MAG: hypothetical protein K8F91_22590, partial [Candidatus Obscuribacterales bacterium]|nr:hypothetical protein [Candidatus Obscuribacterales bacterium]
TEQELKNVGIQMSPSGSLVPLINKDQNAGPIKHYSSQIDQSFQALPAPVLPYYPGRLHLYGAGVNPYASGLNPYWTGLNPYGAGLNLYTNSLNLNGTSLNTSRALNPTTRQIIGKAIPFANAAIGNLPAELNGRFNPPFPGLVPPLLPSRTNFLNGPLFNPYPSLPYTSQGLYGFRGNTGLFFSGTREVQTTTSLTPFLPDWLTH